MYTTPFGAAEIDHDGFSKQLYEVRSDKLIEGYNAGVGNSTVTVTWRDMNSG